ncbi:MAG: PspA/IM30 family protein [Gammaproteobacteria bacterium]|nr:PspA/IM30 family protein [Gammaproteobacteria bacterium]
MSETLTGRVGRIISGSVNTLVDAIENATPEMVMEQAVREIDSSVDDVRTELGRMMAKKHLANKRLMEESRKHKELAEKTNLAIEQGRDDLAEAAIAQQLDIEAQIPILENAIADAANQEKELEGYIFALQAKKREMKEELQLFHAAKKEAAASRNTNSTVRTNSNVQSRVEKATSAFERVVENSTGMPSSHGPSDRKTAVQLVELEALARKNRIQKRLTAIKERA